VTQFGYASHISPTVSLCKKKKNTNIMMLGTATLAPADAGLNTDGKC
jgi:hypothetical protein